MRLTLFVLNIFHQALRRKIRQDTASALRRWWASHGTMVLRLAVPLMAVLALLKLGDEFRRLLWEPGRNGAYDLWGFHNLVRRWFAGMPVYYNERRTALYPPASFVILWPLLGWIEFTPARWLWATTTVAALVWLAYLIVRESHTETRIERVFVALLLLSMNETGVVIGNGQLILHVLPMLVTAVLLLQQGEGGWQEDLVAVGLLLGALVKPSVSIPFLWVALFVRGKAWAISLALLGYVALTLFAVSFQKQGLVVLLQQWLERASAVAARQGYGNLHIWLASLALQGWALPASFLTLVALGVWTYHHRHGDLWILLGVTALVARFWTYHHVSDDVLILLPEIALFRIAKRDGPDARVSGMAVLLLALTAFVMLAPARLFFFYPRPWKTLFTVSHTVVWLLVLIFLLNHARREQKTGAD